MPVCVFVACVWGGVGVWGGVCVGGGVGGAYNPCTCMDPLAAQIAVVSMPPRVAGQALPRCGWQGGLPNTMPNPPIARIQVGTLELLDTAELTQICGRARAGGA